MCEIVSFELAKKLKEKGFEIPTKNIIAMYNELGIFHTLTTSADYHTCADGSKYRCYYDYDDFDEYDYIAPTISQVLKWLRDKHIHLYIDVNNEGWFFEIKCLRTFYMINTDFFEKHNTYEQAALAGIEYAIDNLI